MAAVPCAKCGVSMAVAERTVSYDGKTVSNLHQDCAYWDYAYSLALPHEQPFILVFINGLHAKHAGTAVEWP